MPKAATATKTARTKRSKAEVEKEFEDIRQDLESAKDTAAATTREAERMREQEIRESVQDLTVETAAGRISTLTLDVSRTLSRLSNDLIGEVNRLAAVRAAVELEQKELARLHNIDIAATALDQLVEEHGRRQQELDAEIAAKRAQWEEEARTTERERKEQEEAQRKQRQRENEDFEYRRNIERRKAQEKYEEEQRQLEKRNEEKQEKLERSWQEREQTVKAQEEELKCLRQESASFNERLKTEREQAAADAVRAATAKLDQEILILRKDAENDKRLAELQIRTLDGAIARQNEQIAMLQKQLNDARLQVQDIAIKTIESSAGATALAHVNQIAMEQAKTRSPQG